MNEQEYLNQISSSIRPAKMPKSSSGIGGIFSSIYFKIGIGALIALILIMIVGSILGGGNSDMKTDLATLELRLEGTTEVISEYQQYLKSSRLKSISAALGSELTNTAKKIETYLDEKYEYDTGSLSSTITDAAEYDRISLNNDLFEAKINGLLDRIFVHKMDHEITTFMSEEQAIISSADDSDVQSILKTSYSSLTTIYDEISSFSETK